MIDFIAIFICFSYTNQEDKLTNNRRYVPADRPIKVHFCTITAVYSNILSFIRSGVCIKSKIVYIDRHLRHINAVPVTRTIESHCLYIMVVLYCKTLELIGNSYYSFIINYYMAFSKASCELPS